MGTGLARSAFAASPPPPFLLLRVLPQNGPSLLFTPTASAQGLHALAAYQPIEEEVESCLKTVKVADFVVLSEDPIRVDILRIADIEVLADSKSDRSVYRPNEKTTRHGFGSENSWAE